MIDLLLLFIAIVGSMFILFGLSTINLVVLSIISLPKVLFKPSTFVIIVWVLIFLFLGISSLG